MRLPVALHPPGHQIPCPEQVPHCVNKSRPVLCSVRVSHTSGRVRGACSCSHLGIVRTRSVFPTCVLQRGETQTNRLCTYLGILIFALGCSTRPALQSVLADLASPEYVAILFTLIAVADLIGSAAGTLLLNWIFSIVLDWELDVYLGSPFAIVAVCYLAAFLVSVLVSGSVMHRSRALQVDLEGEDGSE